MKKTAAYTAAALNFFDLVGKELSRNGYAVLKDPIETYPGPHLAFWKNNVLLAACLLSDHEVGLGTFWVKKKTSEVLIEVQDGILIPADTSKLPEYFVRILRMTVAWIYDSCCAELGGVIDAGGISEDIKLLNTIEWCLSDQGYHVYSDPFGKGNHYSTGFVFRDNLYGICWAPHQELVTFGLYGKGPNGIFFDDCLMYSRADVMNTADSRNPLRNLPGLADELDEYVKAMEARSDVRLLTEKDIQI